MSTLYSYTIPVDDGAAPNPFGGVCTLAICKPAIRRTAKVGDWVVGLGSKNAPGGDLSGRVVYAMKVGKVLTMEEYDEYAQMYFPDRIPQVDSLNQQQRLGDCIYDFSADPPTLRESVHREQNRQTDLGGKKVLLSYDFYYFGRNAIPLSKELLPLVHQTQGHKSHANASLFGPFVSWIRRQGYDPRVMHGWPDYTVRWLDGACRNSCMTRLKASQADCIKTC